MTAVAHKRKPGKGLTRRPRKVQVRIVMPRKPAFWTMRKFAASAVLSGFCWLFVVAAVSETTPSRPEGTRVTKGGELFDIVLDGLVPEQRDLTANEDRARPQGSAVSRSVVKSAGKAAQPMPPILDVKVGNDGGDDLTPQQREAGTLILKAQKALQQGNLKTALRQTHRAAELDPDNMAYRLELATLYDRTGSRKGALALYRQVIDAYRDGDETLPATLDVGTIEQRANYLAASAGADYEQVATR